MASRSLDQLVKGAPAPEVLPDLSHSASEPVSLPQSYLEGPPDLPGTQRPLTPDPLSTLPSSPPQIYLNLLILEASLRAQYLTLRERRRQNTFFLLLLAAWIAYFSYALLLRPREDGRGVGGSVYWMVEMGEKVALIGGIVTALLVWGTGQWERGVRWPRRWLAVANRGLRVMNTKVVVIRGPWWQELFSYVSFLFPFWAPFYPSPAGSFHYVKRYMSENARSGGRQLDFQQYYDLDRGSTLVEEDLSLGGDYVRLLLLPKSFSPEFRENWDEYRTNFWDKENERRARLRQDLCEREREMARQDGDWLWWLGIGWRASRRRRLAAATLQRQQKSASESEKSHHRHHHGHHPSISSRLGHETKRSPGRGTSSASHSRTPSRSTTPVDRDERPPSRSSGSGISRRGSTASSVTGSGTEQPHRKKRSSRSSITLGRGLSPLTQAQIREGLETPSSISKSDLSSVTTGRLKDKDDDIGSVA